MQVWIRNARSLASLERRWGPLTFYHQRRLDAAWIGVRARRFAASAGFQEQLIVLRMAGKSYWHGWATPRAAWWKRRFSTLLVLSGTVAC